MNIDDRISRLFHKSRKTTIVSMYLHNEVLEGKPPLTKNFVLPDQSSSWKLRPEVLKLRKRLLILIGLTIVISRNGIETINLFDMLVFQGIGCISFITNCITVAVKDSKKGQSSSGIWLYITPIASLAFYALGFYSTHRCRRDGLLTVCNSIPCLNRIFHRNFV